MEIEEIAKSYIKGSTYIFAGRIISLFLSLIAIIIIARLLAKEYGSTEPFGWLQVLLFLPQLILFLESLGIYHGLINKCAKLLINKNYKEISKYVWTFIFFSLVFYLIYSFLTFILGEWLIINLYSKPEIAHLVYLIAIGILCNYLLGIGQSITVILDKTWILSLSLILYSLAQAILAPLALLLGFKFYGLVFVYFILMPLLASIPCLVLLFKNLPFKKPEFKKFKEMLKFGFPVKASAYTTIPAIRVYEIFISRFSTSAQLGNYSIAQRFSPVVDIFIQSIRYLMLINYSKINKNSDATSALNFTIKVISYFIAPISAFTILFSKQLIIAFFGPYYIEGWFYLTLVSIFWLTYCSGGFAINHMIIAQGYTKEIFKLNVIYSIVALTLNIILIPLFSIIGALVSLIISGWPSYFLSLKFIRKKIGIKLKFNEVIKILIIAFFSVIPSYALWIILSKMIFGIVQYYAILFSCILISTFIYIVFTKKLNILKGTEIDIIEKSLKEIPFVGNIVGNIFGIYKKL